MVPVNGHRETVKDAIGGRNGSVLSYEQGQTAKSLVTFQLPEDCEVQSSGPAPSSLTSKRSAHSGSRKDRQSPVSDILCTEHDDTLEVQIRKDSVISPSRSIIPPSFEVKDEYDEILEKPRPTYEQREAQRQRSRDWLNGERFEERPGGNHWRWRCPSVKTPTKPKAPKA